MRRVLRVLLAVALLCSCARERPSTIPNVLRVAEISEPDHLNPYLSEMNVVYDLSSLVYSYLVIANGDGRLIGDLATQVPSLSNGGISRDGLTYVYHLRRGVLWQDGVPLTSRDVAASWRAVVDPQNDTLFREGYDRVASLETPDSSTVVVRLRKRDPAFVSQFFTPLQEGAKPVLPAHILNREASFNHSPLDSAPVGTGPFRFVRWDRGSQIVLERFTRYFKGEPRLTRIVLRFLPDQQTAATAMRLHDVDLLAAPDSALYALYRRMPGVVTQLRPWNAQQVLVFNQRKAALHDVAVRRAIAAAIDYDVLVRKIARGTAETAYNSLPPTAIGYERFRPRTYDPHRAERMLDAAGYRHLSFSLAFIAGEPEAMDIALAIQQSLRGVGIAVALKPYAYDTIFAPNGPLYSGTFDLALYTTTLQWDPDVFVYVGCNERYPAGENLFGYCDRAVDRLERIGLESDAPATRSRAYRQASRLMWRDVSYLPLFELRRLVVRDRQLQNYSTAPGASPWWDAWRWEMRGSRVIRR